MIRDILVGRSCVVFHDILGNCDYYSIRNQQHLKYLLVLNREII